MKKERTLRYYRDALKFAEKRLALAKDPYLSIDNAPVMAKKHDLSVNSVVDVRNSLGIKLRSRNPATTEKREEVLKDMAGGEMTIIEISKKHGVPSPTISGWSKKYNVKPKPGPSSTIDPDLKDRMIDRALDYIIAGYTLGEVQDELQKEFGRRLARSSLSKWTSPIKKAMGIPRQATLAKSVIAPHGVIDFSGWGR